MNCKSLKAASALAIAMAIAACGKVGDLEPRAGSAMPPKAYGQKTAQTADSLTTPSVQARPGRSDELLKRSERRTDDPFDLPPGEAPKLMVPPDTTPDSETAPK